MKLLVLRDPKIDQDTANAVCGEFIDMYRYAAGIDPTFVFIPFAYKNVPLEPDNDGDLKPTHAWLKKTIKDVYDKYAEQYDHVVLWVHEDNWVFKGIWGTNFSNVFNGYQVHLCRFDKDNQANTLGTLHHEVMHAHDAFIYAMTAEQVNHLIPTENWDRGVVHGQDQRWKYIRHKENLAALSPIADLLKRSYEKRRETYKNRLRKKIIYLAQRVIVLIRQLISRKYGVPR